MARFVNPHQELNPPRGRKERWQPNEKDYQAFIGSLPCCLTGAPAQVAHINKRNPAYGHMGRGKGEKAHYSSTLPIAPARHIDMDNGDFTQFWEHWFDLNPFDLCARLARVYLEYPDPDRIAVAISVIESWRAGE